MNDQLKRVLDQMNQRVTHLERAIRSLFMRQVRTRQRTAEIEARIRLAEAGRKPVMPVEFRSQFGEDVLIWDLFRGQLDGFFIEVGAYNGYQLSVTYALEAVGWKGLLIEPIPEAFEACKERRKSSRVVNAALSRPGAPATTSLSVTTDQLFSHLQNIPSHSPTGPGWSEKTISVQQTTMNDLLKDHNGPIDAAVIDVEGGEMDLLAGFDLAKYRPRMMLIEDNTLSNREIPELMKRHGYKPVGVLEVNLIFVHQDEKALLERLSEI